MLVPAKAALELAASDPVATAGVDGLMWGMSRGASGPATGTGSLTGSSPASPDIYSTAFRIMGIVSVAMRSRACSNTGTRSKVSGFVGQ